MTLLTQCFLRMLMGLQGLCMQLLCVQLETVLLLLDSFVFICTDNMDVTLTYIDAIYRYSLLYTFILY